MGACLQCMGVCLQCGTNKIYRRHLIVEMAFFVHTEMYRENTMP